MNDSQVLGHLLLLPKTDRWTSAIANRLNQFPLQLRVMNSPSEIFEQLSDFSRSLIIWELDRSLPAIELCPSEVVMSENRHTKLFAVGNFETRSIHLDLIRSGFSEAFHSTAEVDRLLHLAVKVIQRLPAERLSIEQRVARDLPWTPISE